MLHSIFEKNKLGLTFNSNDKQRGIIDLSHRIRIKVLQKAYSCNSGFFGSSVCPFVLPVLQMQPIWVCLFKAELDR